MLVSQSKPDRWAAAIETAFGALNQLEGAYSYIEWTLEQLDEIRHEYECWRDNLPSKLSGGEGGETLEAINTHRPLNRLEPAYSILEGALKELEKLRSEYESQYYNLPDNLRYSRRAEKLEAFTHVSFEVEVRRTSFRELEELVDTAWEMLRDGLPRGYGRD
jgi:hypothetical protein